MGAGLNDLIPGLREAEKQYLAAQEEAFAGVEPLLCGLVEIRPFSPQMFIELDGIESAFFHQKPINESEIAVFLWRVSAGYRRSNEDLRRYFIASIALIDFEQATKEIFAYIRRSTVGRPLGDGKSAPLARWPALLVDLFASEYGWLEEYILNLPFRRLWQYANRIYERNDRTYRERCAASMELRQAWLLQRQQLRELAAAKGRN